MKKIVFSVTAIMMLFGASSWADGQNADRIKPYEGDPRYWQYKGEPVLLFILL